MEKDDQELIQDYFAGDKNALKILISRYLKAVYSFTYRLSGNAEEANDITQETFVKVWKHLKKFDPKKKFSTWVFAIARNTTIDWLRKKRPALFSDMNADGIDGDAREEFEQNIPDDSLLQHEVFEQKESAVIAESALESLPMEHKTIVILHVNHELTFEEIAVVVKKPMNTVKSQYRRALLTMRKQLKKDILKGHKDSHQKGPHSRIHSNE